MYHHHGPRPPHHQPPPNQHPNRNPSNMMPQPMGFQFPRPTQLPDELESALAIRGVSDMDHRLMDHMSRPNQHQNQSSGPGMSQHGGFGSNPMTLPPDQSGVDWSGYQPPAKLFAGPPSHAGHQSQQHRGPQQRPQSWKPPLSDSHSTQARHPQGGGESQGMYTPESAGSILASFGLSNEDLEVLSHYPDDQLTPDTLPFILRDIQINKSGTQNSAASASSFSHGIQDMPLPPSHSSPMTRSRSPEVPSLLAVTQTAGKVIDYGHASRAEEETTRETFKREPLSSERTVKMYPSPMVSAPKPVKPERRQVRLEHTEPIKHRDQDYRRTINDHRKRSRSPRREFQLSPKPHAQDRDYRREAPRPRPSSEPRSEASSGRSPSSTSSSKPHIGGGSKKLPTPTMISDFSAVSPKVYPHTCSLCHTQCDQEKDWINHINTVNHTAACRDLRNKYPDWKPNIPSGSGRHGSRTSRSPPQSASASRSVSPSPPHSKHRAGPPHQRPHGRPYPPHYDSHHQVNKGGPFRSSLKRPNDETSHQPSSMKTSHGTRHGPPQSATKAVKVGTKPGAKTTKTASGKAADTPAKPPPAKKKKKVAPAPSQDSSVADRLVYLMGIPQDASEQEVTDLVGSFGKINNVILMPCSEEEGEKDKGQKASVCMIKAEDAQALAKSAELQIREQKITAVTAKKPKEEKSNGANSSAESAEQDKGADCRDTGTEADQQLPEEKCKVLITGLPDSGWSESNITELVQPFGMPSDIIAAPQIGKVLVSMQDTDTVQEMVKVNTFRPLKMGDAELKLFSIKQSISLSTPVALYNLLMGSANPLETPSLVSWSSLLVIRNVPSMPSASCEVQKLVRRFGTVIKTLVLSNMVICEMATAAMALSVFKRFQAFPCIIHNSPLFFSRKADPKTNTPNKVISAYLDSAEETPANGKDSRSSEAPEEEKAAEPSAEAKEDKDVNMEEKTQSTEAKAEEEASGENGSKEDKDEAAPEPAAAPEVKPEADVETKKTPTVETTKGGKDVGESRAKSDKPAGKAKTSDAKASPQKTPSKEQPKVAPEKAISPQEKSKTNQESKSNKTETPTNKKQEAQPQKKSGQKSTAEAKESTRSMAEEEAARMREKEQKEREARKEKERKDRERREREKEERAKKEKERAERTERSRKERERRDEERRERERRRLYGDGYIGKRSSSRSEGRRRSSEREEQKKTLEEQEEMDDFPFNLSDFVTVDEVGDVADIPSSPPSALLEDGEKEAPVTVQKAKEEDKPADETGTSDATETQPQASENVEEGGLIPSDQTAGPVLTAGTSPPDSAHEPTPGPTGQPEDHGTESTQTAAPDSASEPHPLPTPADSPSHPPEMEKTEQEEEEEQPDEAVRDIEVKQEKEEAVSEAQEKEEQQEAGDGGRVKKEEKEEEVKEQEEAVDSGRVKKEEEEEEMKEQEEIDDSRRVNKEEEEEETLVSNRAEDEEEKQSRDPAALSVKQERPEDEEEEESRRKKIRTEEPLPPFDPNNPVGMKYLVPKTGFFCKVCNRFFSGTKEAEISHCKTLKHYENLQKFLQSRKTVNDASKRDPS